ncbi:hypothetical protein PflQ2_0088 [Pseudomonas fluorescens Q2-87]|uniref:Uncharacterized protein n=1 Tax=Pseudomonas fluorescens (strain Q2-87) TaxID=1038922 RepID=J2XWR3_PSEFQ|nr:hypothetical protein PflQ2_0088 [Pseudomonas fluorescens Q2-87]
MIRATLRGVQRAGRKLAHRIPPHLPTPQLTKVKLRSPIAGLVNVPRQGESEDGQTYPVQFPRRSRSA